MRILTVVLEIRGGYLVMFDRGLDVGSCAKTAVLPIIAVEGYAGKLVLSPTQM